MANVGLDSGVNGDARRELAWIALADLFRDTEMTSSDLQYIAETLRGLGYSVADAEQILRDDLIPVFGWNTFSAAGNWAGWREGEVVALVRAWLARRDRRGLAGMVHRHPLARGLRTRLLGGSVMADWARVAVRM